MAFMKGIIDLKGILFLMLLTVTSQATNLDCNGKAFRCVNSTHFMICVDLGVGISMTIDDLVIPCPSPTVCKGINRFECEFPPPPTQSSTVTIAYPTTTESEVTTFAPLPTTSIPFEEYLNTVSITTLSQNELQPPPADIILSVKPIDISNLSTTEKVITDKPILSNVNTHIVSVLDGIVISHPGDINSNNVEINSTLNVNLITNDPTSLKNNQANIMQTQVIESSNLNTEYNTLVTPTSNDFTRTGNELTPENVTENIFLSDITTASINTISPIDVTSTIIKQTATTERELAYSLQEPTNTSSINNDTVSLDIVVLKEPAKDAKQMNISQAVRKRIAKNESSIINNVNQVSMLVSSINDTYAVSNKTVNIEQNLVTNFQEDIVNTTIIENISTLATTPISIDSIKNVNKVKVPKLFTNTMEHTTNNFSQGQEATTVGSAINQFDISVTESSLMNINQSISRNGTFPHRTRNETMEYTKPESTKDFIKPLSMDTTTETVFINTEGYIYAKSANGTTAIAEQTERNEQVTTNILGEPSISTISDNLSIALHTASTVQKQQTNNINASKPLDKINDNGSTRVLQTNVVNENTTNIVTNTQVFDLTDATGKNNVEGTDLPVTDSSSIRIIHKPISEEPFLTSTTPILILNHSISTTENVTMPIEVTNLDITTDAFATVEKKINDQLDTNTKKNNLDFNKIETVKHNITMIIGDENLHQFSTTQSTVTEIVKEPRLTLSDNPKSGLVNIDRSTIKSVIAEPVHIDILSENFTSSTTGPEIATKKKTTILNSDLEIFTNTITPTVDITTENIINDPLSDVESIGYDINNRADNTSNRLVQNEKVLSTNFLDNKPSIHVNKSESNRENGTTIRSVLFNETSPTMTDLLLLEERAMGNEVKNNKHPKGNIITEFGNEVSTQSAMSSATHSSQFPVTDSTPSIMTQRNYNTDTISQNNTSINVTDGQTQMVTDAKLISISNETDRLHTSNTINSLNKQGGYNISTEHQKLITTTSEISTLTPSKVVVNENQTPEVIKILQQIDNIPMNTSTSLTSTTPAAVNSVPITTNIQTTENITNIPLSEKDIKEKPMAKTSTGNVTISTFDSQITQNTIIFSTNTPIHFNSFEPTIEPIPKTVLENITELPVVVNIEQGNKSATSTGNMGEKLTELHETAVNLKQKTNPIGNISFDSVKHVARNQISISHSDLQNNTIVAREGNNDISKSPITLTPNKPTIASIKNSDDPSITVPGSSNYIASTQYLDQNQSPESSSSSGASITVSEINEYAVSTPIMITVDQNTINDQSLDQPESQGSYISSGTGTTISWVTNDAAIIQLTNFVNPNTITDHYMGQTQSQGSLSNTGASTMLSDASTHATSTQLNIQRDPNTATDVSMGQTQSPESTSDGTSTNLSGNNKSTSSIQSQTQPPGSSSIDNAGTEVFNISAVAASWLFVKAEMNATTDLSLNKIPWISSNSGAATTIFGVSIDEANTTQTSRSCSNSNDSTIVSGASTDAARSSQAQSPGSSSRPAADTTSSGIRTDAASTSQTQSLKSSSRMAADTTTAGVRTDAASISQTQSPESSSRRAADTTSTGVRIDAASTSQTQSPGSSVWSSADTTLSDARTDAASTSQTQSPDSSDWSGADITLFGASTDAGSTSRANSSGSSDWSGVYTKWSGVSTVAAITSQAQSPGSSDWIGTDITLPGASNDAASLSQAQKSKSSNWIGADIKLSGASIDAARPSQAQTPERSDWSGTDITLSGASTDASSPSQAQSPRSSSRSAADATVPAADAIITVQIQSPERSTRTDAHKTLPGASTDSASTIQTQLPGSSSRSVADVVVSTASTGAGSTYQVQPPGSSSINAADITLSGTSTDAASTGQNQSPGSASWSVADTAVSGATTDAASTSQSYLLEISSRGDTSTPESSSSTEAASTSQAQSQGNDWSDSHITLPGASTVAAITSQVQSPGSSDWSDVDITLYGVNTDAASPSLAQSPGSSSKSAADTRIAAVSTNAIITGQIQSPEHSSRTDTTVPGATTDTTSTGQPHLPKSSSRSGDSTTESSSSTDAASTSQAQSPEIFSRRVTYDIVSRVSTDSVSTSQTYLPGSSNRSGAGTTESISSSYAASTSQAQSPEIFSKSVADTTVSGVSTDVASKSKTQPQGSTSSSGAGTTVFETSIDLTQLPDSNNQSQAIVVTKSELRTNYSSFEINSHPSTDKIDNIGYIEPTTVPFRRDLANVDNSQLFKGTTNTKLHNKISTVSMFSTVQPTETFTILGEQKVKVSQDSSKFTVPVSSADFGIPIEVVKISDVLVKSDIESEKTHSGIISLLTKRPKSSEPKEKTEKPENKETEDKQQYKHAINVELVSLEDKGLFTPSTDMPIVFLNKNSELQKHIKATEELLITTENNNYKTTNYNNEYIATKISAHKNTDNNTNTYKKKTPTHELSENRTSSTNDSHTSNNKSLDQNMSFPQAHNKTVISNDQNSTSRYMPEPKTTATNNMQTTRYSELESTTSKTESSNFSCKQMKRGRYSDELDCRKFYVCPGNKSRHVIEGTCPVNTVFSEINKQCTKNLSHCIRNNQFRCVTEGRFSDFLNDNVYYICVRNNLSHFIRFKLQCQNGYHLNKTSVRCDLNNESTSTSQDSKSVSEPSSSSTKQEYEKSEKKFKCKKEGIFPDPSNCRKYFECNKVDLSYRQKRKKCDSDEIFHKDKKKCVDADSYEC